MPGHQTAHSNDALASTTRGGHAASTDAPISPSDALGTMLRLVRGLFTYAPRDAAVVIVLSVAVTFTSGVGLVMLVPLLGVAGLDVGGGSIGQLSQLVTTALAAVGLEMTIPSVIGAFLAVIALGAALERVHAVRTARLYSGFVASVRRRVHEAITRSGWTHYVRRPTSSFVHVLTQEVERMGGATTGMINLGISSLLTMFYVGLALFLSPLATLLVIACGGSLLGLLARSTRLGRAKGEALSGAWARLHASIAEHLAGMRVSKSHGLEPFHLERFGERVGRTADAQVDLVRNRASVGFWMKVGSATIMAGVFVFALSVLELPLASILLMLFLFSRLVPMLSGLQRNVQEILTMLPSVDRVEQMVMALEAVAEPADGDVEAPRLTSALTFERVHFRYDGALGVRDTSSSTAGADVAGTLSTETAVGGLASPVDGGSTVSTGDADSATVVLRDVDLVIQAGKTTAIVGPSGAGKSTVADLAVGLLHPTEGRVAVDGVTLEGARVHAWRRRLGYVNQDTFLFNETIRENLRLVRRDASEDEIRAALKGASASFVDALPDGLDTVVGDRGVRLSGGERQRIALARAILRTPTLLLLDEATSALDPENEHVIQTAIERMAGQLTILIIAHRLASVRRADVIYVMERGRVVESGAWDDLVARPDGRFRALCLAQGLLAVADGSTRAVGVGPLQGA